MSATTAPTNNSGALTFYLIAAIIVVGLVAGTVLWGLMGLTVWMIVMTFVVFAVLLGISVS